MDKQLPTTKTQRGKIIGKTLLKMGGVKSKNLIKRTFSSKQKKEKLDLQMHEELAKAIFDALGELKGISVKIAQQLALGMPFLPPQYLKELEKSFHQIPTINKALVRKILKNEFNKRAEEIFDNFENEAFGAASLGQVHRATLEGKKVAVKIQYPGIKKSIQSDISILQFGLKRAAKGKDVSHLIEEIQERIFEEVDYTLEAQNNTFFAQNLQLPHIKIPTVYPSHSTQHILTTSFIEGKSFEEFLASNPTQELKDHYAQLIFDSFFHALYKLKTLHADPNPGNFIFMENGDLGMIDFGCIKQIDNDFLKKYNNLHLALHDGVSDEEAIKHYLDLEMIDPMSQEEMLEFYQETIKPCDNIYMEIFKEGSYDFKEHKDFSKRGFELVLEIQKKQFHALHKINQEFIFIDRTLLGYYGMFERMKAKINTTKAIHILRDYQGENNAL